MSNRDRTAETLAMNRQQVRSWITQTHNRLSMFTTDAERNAVNEKARTIQGNWQTFEAQDTNDEQRYRTANYLLHLTEIIAGTTIAGPGAPIHQATVSQQPSTSQGITTAGLGAHNNQASSADGQQGGSSLVIGSSTTAAASAGQSTHTLSQQPLQNATASQPNQQSQFAQPPTGPPTTGPATSADQVHQPTLQQSQLPPIDQSRILITTAGPSQYASTPQQAPASAAAEMFYPNQTAFPGHGNANAVHYPMQYIPPGAVMQPVPQVAVGQPNQTNLKVIDRLLPQAKFTGKFAEWPQFWRTFEQVIHANAGLDYLTKVSYLRFMLAGEAATLVNSYPPDQRGYERAIEALVGKYNQEQMVRQELIKKFEEGKSQIEDDFNFEAISSLERSLQTVVTELQALQSPEWVFNELLLPKAFVLAPPRILQRMAEDNTVRFQTFLNHLTNYKDGLQNNRHMMPKAAISSVPESRKRTNQSRPVGRSKSVKQTSTSQASSSALNVTRKAYFCWLCENPDHFASRCDKFKSAEDKKRRIQEQNRCTRCAESGHEIETCPNDWINCTMCTGPHLNWLCTSHQQASGTKRKFSFRSKGKRQSASKESRPAAAEENEQSTSQACLLHSADQVYLKIIAVKAIGVTTLVIHALLDDGAHHCFVTRQLCKQMNWKISSTPAMKVNGFGGQAVIPVRSKARIQLAVANCGQKFECDAFVVEQICGPVVTASSKMVYDRLAAKMISVNAQVTRVWTKSVGADEPAKMISVNSRVRTESARATQDVDILLGADVLQVVQTGEIIRLTRSLSIVKTIFGSCLTGAEEVNCEVTSEATSAATVTVTDTQSGVVDVSNLWASEGLSEPKEEKLAAELMKKVRESLRLEDKRYSIGLPWLDEPKLGDNFAVAIRRLRLLIQKLKKDGQYEEYQNAISQLHKDEYAERIESDSRTESYYMPHHGVWREQSSTKLRIVFDMSSHTRRNKSLNEILTKGINLNPLMHFLLLKFRFGKFAMTADLKQAFHQINVNESDRNYMKFLWLSEAGELIAYRMKAIPFGSTSSPFLLALVIKSHLENFAPSHPIAHRLNENIYVDDILLSTNDLSDLTKIKVETENLFELCSMTVHKWKTSHIATNAQWTTDQADASQVKVLGVIWDLQTDHLSAKFTPLPYTVVTKRVILSQLGSLYNPVGEAGPIVMKFKVIFREAFLREKSKSSRSKGNSIDWDEPVNESLASEFGKAVKSLEGNVYPQVARFTHSDPERAALVIFTDACKTGYGAVAYVVDFADRKAITLLKSKSKVSPVKHPRTMNEMELQGALLGAELYTECAKATRIYSVLLFTDSSTVLNWLTAHPNKLKPFVNNRINKILLHTDVNQWQHVAGDQNPADILSRGETLAALLKKRIWIEAPPFVQQIQLTEFRRKSESIATLASEVTDHPLANLQNINSWSDLIKFARQKGFRSPISRYQFLMKAVQEMNFKAEIVAIKAGNHIPVGSRLRDKVPFVDQLGILRVKTRLNTSNEDFDNPIVLDGQNKFVQLWARHLHTVYCHISAKFLRDVLREKHFILGATKLASKAASCGTCLKDRARNFKPPPGPIPAWRTQAKNAFCNVGLDFFGPLQVHPTGSRKGTLQTRYGLLFTCAVTRAVHIEIVHDTSAASVWLAIRQFLSRRGPVQLMYSDNATCFRRVAKDIALLHSHLKDSVEKGSNDIRLMKWIFTAPNSPWQGGFYERLVGDFKKHFRRSVSSHLIEDLELTALATEIEAVMNSRPLGLLPDGTLLRPSHFLIGGTFTNVPGFRNNQPVPSPLKAFQARRRALNAFWRAWRTSYLANLQGRYAQPGSVQKLTVGQSALVKDQTAKRSEWKTAVIEEELPSKDGHCRNYKVKIGKDHFIRSVQNLVPLELDLVGADVVSRPPPGGPAAEAN